MEEVVVSHEFDSVPRAEMERLAAVVLREARRVCDEYRRAHGTR